MTNSVYSLLSGQIGLRNHLNVVANNLANVNTSGFKGQDTLFRSHVERLDMTGERLNMALDHDTYRNFRQGALNPTGNPLDLAIEGDGLFAYETPNGTAYGRDGRLARDVNGDLVTMTGYRILDAAGAPITINADAPSFSVANNGTISTPDGQIVGQVGVYQTDTTALNAIGDGLFTTEQPVELKVDGVVRQGMTEASNVQSVIELTNLITLQRAYERGKSLMDKEDERITNMLRTLGRSS